MRASHWMKRSCVRIENKAEDFQSNDAQERLVAGLSEDHRSMSLAHGQRYVAFGYLPYDERAVRQRKGHASFWSDPDSCPGVVRK